MGNKATDIDEQIIILRNRGLIIENEKKAREILLDIGYFRLGFYLFPFEENYPEKDNRNHQYKENSNLKDAVDLYYFDYSLRLILLKYINRIEINFKTFLTNVVSIKYKEIPTWFVHPSIVSGHYISTFEDKVYNNEFKKNPIIKHHHKEHINDKYAPAWKTIEFMTFGAIILLYHALKDEDIKDKISEHYGIKKRTIFENYIEIVKYIRNTCAHGGVLFDLAMPKSVKKGPAWKENNNNHNLYAAIQVIHYMVSQISMNRANELRDELNKLFDEISEMSSVYDIVIKTSGYKRII